MTLIDKDIARAINNLDSVSKTAVPRANAQALNRVTKRVVTRIVRDTAKEARVQQKLIRNRVKVVKAHSRNSSAYLYIGRGGIPAIAIGSARTQIKRRNGRMLTSASRRNGRGRFVSREFSGNTSIRVGRYVFQNAFLQKLANGKWHIMERSTDSRYPIKVATIPIVEPVTRYSKIHSQDLLYTDMPKELAAALKQQLRLVIKRK